MLIKRRSGTGIANGLAQAQQGFLQGSQLGLEKRRTDNQEADFLRRAQIADQELQREAQGREAGAQAIGEAAQIPADKQEPNAQTMGGQPAQGAPTPETQGTQDADTAAMQKVATIAQKMARAGDMKGAQQFVDYMQKRHVEAKDNRDRDNLVKRIQIFLEGANTYATAPDQSRVEDPKLAEAMSGLAEKATDKNVTTSQLHAELAAAQNAQIESRSRQGHRDQMLAHYMQRSADAMVAGDVKAPGRSEQAKKLETLRNVYEIQHDQFYGDKKWQDEFDSKFADVESGQITIPDEKGNPTKVPIASAEQFQQIFQRNAQLEQESTALKNQLAQAQIKKEGSLAAKNEADARYTDRNKPGRLGGQAQAKPLARGDARKQAADELNTAYAALTAQIKADNEGSADKKKPYPPPPSAADIAARTDEIMNDMKGGAADSAFQPTSFMKSGAATTQPQGAVTQPAQTTPAPQSQDTLKTPQDRQADSDAHPEKYAGKFKTLAEFQMWVSTGQMPR